MAHSEHVYVPEGTIIYRNGRFYRLLDSHCMSVKEPLWEQVSVTVAKEKLGDTLAESLIANCPHER